MPTHSAHHARGPREPVPAPGARGQRVRWSLLVAAGLAAITAAVAVTISTLPSPVRAGYVPTGRSPASQLAAPVPSSRAALPAPAVPTELRIPSLQIGAPIVPVTVAAGGALGVPANPRTLGWWSGGAAPGSSTGSTVLDGHVDSAALGLGALFTLRHVQVGAPVLLTAGAATLRYQVVGVREYAKANLPASVFTSAGPGRLVLITCGGAFDRASRHYADNIVVYAVPAAA